MFLLEAPKGCKQAGVDVGLGGLRGLDEGAMPMAGGGLWRFGENISALSEKPTRPEQ